MNIEKAQHLKPWIILISALFTAGCSNTPTISINREYISNSLWGENQPPQFILYEINLLNGVDTLSMSSLDGFLIHNNVNKDKKSGFGVIFNENCKLNVIYFNETNDGLIWYNKKLIHEKSTSIGKLKLKSWYRFDNVHETWVYYVYIDEHGASHEFKVNPVNW